MNLRSTCTALSAILAASAIAAPLSAQQRTAKAPAAKTHEIHYAAKLPSEAKGEQQGQSCTLSNDTIAFAWKIDGGKLRPVALKEIATGTTHDLSARDLFRIGLKDIPGLPEAKGFVPCNLSANDFAMLGQPRIVRLPANPRAVKTADRFAGHRLVARFHHAGAGVDIEWSAELRDGSHYIRQTLRIAGTKGVLTGMQGLDLAVTGARQVGTAAAGNPAATDSLFMGLELPMGKNDISGDGVRMGVACQLPLEKGVIYETSSVVGAYPEGQLRRAFLRYIERERAAPYRAFLHYNGWFDFDRNVNEKGMLETIEAYDRELIKGRGVPVASFVIDDGWDDWDAGFWAINRRKFPNEFKAVGKKLDSVKSRFGIWISPLAGYDHADQRIAHAAKAGLTPGGAQRLDLSHPPYYKWFLERCTSLVRDDKVAYFKFDKAGNGVNPHFLALLRICRELRQVDPLVVINITVGTWPSPFWLNHIDCTWREGGDMGHEGPGNARESWITYRDAQTWRGVVSKGPLYPLNSIMNHGIVLSDGHFFAKDTLKGNNSMAPGGTDMRNEVRSFFGAGTLMQELYVKPSCTPAESWDQIAEAAKWARANADILVDTHWVGENPSNGACIYGWAAWAPRKAILTLRNPSDKDDSIEIDPAKVFELPKGATATFSVKSAYADTPSPVSRAEGGKAAVIPLKPFQVLVLEFTPSK